MAIYIINSKKSGKQYGIRFRCIEKGIQIHKNLRPFKTQSEAKRAKYEYLLNLEQQKPIDETARDDLTFGALYKKYLFYARDNLAPSSINDYDSCITKYILPIFENDKIKEITKRKISDWQDALPAELGYKYKSKLKTAFSAVFTYAVNKELLEINPLKGVEKIRNTDSAKTLNYWDKSEFDKFISVVDDDLWKAFFTFLYVSGGRKGEMFALTWDDINFSKNTITINKTYSARDEMSIKKFSAKRKNSTKNKKTGDIYMPKSILDLLNPLPRGKYVFGKDSPLAATTMATAFNKYTKLAGVKKIRPHDLRHSCAALFISMGGNNELSTLYALAERLRDSPEQILKTYGHLFPSRQAVIIKMLDETFK